jgi:hypothetical protein
MRNISKFLATTTALLTANQLISQTNAFQIESESDGLSLAQTSSMAQLTSQLKQRRRSRGSYRKSSRVPSGVAKSYGRVPQGSPRDQGGNMTVLSSYSMDDSSQGRSQE